MKLFNAIAIFLALCLLAPSARVTASQISTFAYNLVQDEGSNLTRRSTINFVGAGVTAADSGGVTTVTINGGGSGGSCDSLGGDLSGTCTSATVAKVNGVAYPSGPSTHQIPLITASNTAIYKTVTDCNANLQALNFTQSTDLFSCRTFAAPLHSAATFVIDGGGSALTTGALGLFPTADFSCTINRTDISADQSGSITVDIWKKAGAIPSAADKISASAPVTLSSSQLNQNGSITGWSTAVSAGDVFGGTIASTSTVQRVMVQIWCQ